MKKILDFFKKLFGVNSEIPKPVSTVKPKKSSGGTVTGSEPYNTKK